MEIWNGIIGLKLNISPTMRYWLEFNHQQWWFNGSLIRHMLYNGMNEETNPQKIHIYIYNLYLMEYNGYATNNMIYIYIYIHVMIIHPIS